jgi:threonine aldolase
MNFKSDNTAGAAPEIFAALSRANDGAMTSYGADAVTQRIVEKLSTLFEKEVAAFPVATGTAANALALATLTPHYGTIFCHELAHINIDECGAPEFYSQGAKLTALKGAHGKLTPEIIKAGVGRFLRGDVHNVQPATISLTQSTELGTIYTPAEIRAIADLAKAERLALHMDGARFANAIATLNCTPAEATWKAGVDALSFGLTKNGALAAEVVVFFDPARVADFEYRRKRAGHLLSKMRFVSAQVEAMLDDSRWLNFARHANTMARRLADGLTALSGIAIEHPVQANEVFARLPSKAVQKALEGAGAKFFLWEPVTDGRPLIRLVCSWATQEREVEAFITAAKQTL